jgi:hypothetical protein
MSPAKSVGQKLAAEQGAEHRRDLGGGRDDAAAGAMERNVDRSDVDRARPSRQDRVVGRQVAVRAVAA